MTTIEMPRDLDLAAVAAMADADVHHKYELSAEGELTVMTVATPEHARIVSRLIFWLFRHGFTDEQVRTEMGVYTGGGRQPDISVWLDGAPTTGMASEYATPAGLALVVEVVSRSSRRTDLTLKADEYAAVGVPHYWTVDQDGIQSVTRRYRSGDGRYIALAPEPLEWLLNQDPHLLIAE